MNIRHLVYPGSFKIDLEIVLKHFDEFSSFKFLNCPVFKEGLYEEAFESIDAVDNNMQRDLILMLRELGENEFEAMLRLLYCFKVREIGFDKIFTKLVTIFMPYLSSSTFMQKVNVTLPKDNLISDVPQFGILNWFVLGANEDEVHSLAQSYSSIKADNVFRATQFIKENLPKNYYKNSFSILYAYYTFFIHNNMQDSADDLIEKVLPWIFISDVRYTVTWEMYACIRLIAKDDDSSFVRDSFFNCMERVSVIDAIDLLHFCVVEEKQEQVLECLNFVISKFILPIVLSRTIEASHETFHKLNDMVKEIEDSDTLSLLQMITERLEVC